MRGEQEYAASQNIFPKEIIIRFLFAGAVGQCAQNLSGTMAGDTTSPNRGFNPGNSYAMGDIESVSTANGNVMLHIPFAALPAGRAGLTAKLNLVYNSKLWDSQVAWGIDNSRPCNPSIDPFCTSSPAQDPLNGDPVCTPNGICDDGGKNPGGGGGGGLNGGITWVQQNVIVGDESGGWNYGYKYSLQVIQRNITNPNPGGFINCYDGVTLDIPNSRLNMYRYRVQMTFPDGSVHTMIPQGLVSLTSDGYYNTRPDGFQENCASGTWATGPMSYYTTDGTYAKLVVAQDTDQMWWNNPWTLYMADGSRVVSDPVHGLETIYDRNGNYIQVQQIADFIGNTAETNGYVEATVITDQLGRSMTIVYDHSTGLTFNPHPVDIVQTTSTNGLPLTYQISWGFTWVNKNYWAGEGVGGAFDPYLLPLKMAMGVIQSINIKERTDIPPYQFSYNGSVFTSMQDTPPTSTGWGELSALTLPSGASTSYAYSMDGVQGDLNNLTKSFDVMDNGPKTKTLSYLSENDCATTPCPTVHETTSYFFHRANNLNNTADYCQITAPDGGVTREDNGVFSGLSYRTTNPDGTIVEKYWVQNDGLNPANPTPVNHSIPYPPPTNPHVKKEYTSIANQSGVPTQTIVKDYSVDLNGNSTQVNEYDFATYSNYQALSADAFGIRNSIPSGATLKRVTVNTYNNPVNSLTDTNYYQNPASPQLRGLLATTEIQDGSGNLVAHSETTYDNPSTTGNVIQQKSWDSSKGVSEPLHNDFGIAHL